MSLQDLHDEPVRFPKGLLPPADGAQGFLLGIKSALKAAASIDRIPLALKPRHGFSYAPPKVNFGWSMTDDEVFSALEVTHPDFITNALFHDALDDTSEEDVDPEATMECVYQYMIKELKLPEIWRPRIEHKKRDSDTDHLRCLTITNTYVNGTQQPPEEVVRAMKDIFGLDTDPRWFLDFHHGVWRQRWIFINEDGELEIIT